MKTVTCVRPRSKLARNVCAWHCVMCMSCVFNQSKACATFNAIFAVAFETFGLNKVYSHDIIVHLKQNTISCTTSQTAYVSTALTLKTQNYRDEL